MSNFLMAGGFYSLAFFVEKKKSFYTRMLF